MKRLLSLLFALILLLSLSFSALAEEVGTPSPEEAGVNSVKDPIYDITLDSQGVYLVNTETDTVIYKKAENARMSPASTTKIMTALLVLEACPDPKNTTVTVTDTEMFSYILEMGGVNMQLSKGETFTVYDLLVSMMVKSSCDVGDLLGSHLEGSVSAFVEKMNQKALSFGLKDTHFENTHGLHHNNHYSSPHDIAVIFREALKNPTFREIISIRKYTVPATEKSGPRTVEHTVAAYSPKNSHYHPAFVGGKSGFTNQAGRCLVTLSEQNGVSFISVLMGANMENRTYPGNMAQIETRTLIEYAYDHYSVTSFYEKGEKLGEVKVKDSEVSLPVVAKDTLSLLVRGGSEPIVTTSIPEEIDLSAVADGAVIGEISVGFREREGTVTLPLSLQWDGTPITTKSYLEKKAEGAAAALSGIFREDKVFVSLLIMLLLTVALCIPAIKITQRLHKKKSHRPKH
jgi:D-alanyl-D-alanine carboxypeptidase